MQGTSIGLEYGALADAVNDLITASAPWRAALLKAFPGNSHRHREIQTTVAILESNDGLLQEISMLAPAQLETFRFAIFLVRTYKILTQSRYDELLLLQLDAADQEIPLSVSSALKKVWEANDSLEQAVNAAAPPMQAGTSAPQPGNGSSALSTSVMVPSSGSTPSGGTAGGGASSGRTGTPPGGTAGSTATDSTGPGKAPVLPLIISLLHANKLLDSNPIVIATSALLAGHTPSPALQDKDIEPLIEAWRKAVDTFTNTDNWNSKPVTPLPLILGLIELHAQLEVLYDQLINIEEGARVSVTSLLSIR